MLSSLTHPSSQFETNTSLGPPIPTLDYYFVLVDLVWQIFGRQGSSPTSRPSEPRHRLPSRSKITAVVLTTDTRSQNTTWIYHRSYLSGYNMDTTDSTTKLRVTTIVVVQVQVHSQASELVLMQYFLVGTKPTRTGTVMGHTNVQLSFRISTSVRDN